MLDKTTTAHARGHRDPIDAHVGARVRMRRMQLGMSQDKLGQALGLTFQQVQKYEKGANRMGASRLVAIARIMQVQVAWFFEGLSDKTVGANDKLLAEYCSPELTNEFLSTTSGMKLVKGFMGLPDATRTKLVALVVQMAADNDEA